MENNTETITPTPIEFTKVDKRRKYVDGYK